MGRKGKAAAGRLEGSGVRNSPIVPFNLGSGVWGVELMALEDCRPFLGTIALNDHCWALAQSLVGM